MKELKAVAIAKPYKWWIVLATVCMILLLPQAWQDPGQSATLSNYCWG